jgi:glycosyltransferase involved in cell wall biosynthesis
MHILHLIKTSAGAGWALNIMKEIKKNDPSITFSIIVPKGGRFFDEYHKICAHVIEFEYSLSPGIFSNGKLFKKIVKDINPDIIHSWFTQTTLYSRMFLRDLNIPKVYQVVGPAHLENTIFKLGDIKSATKNDFWIATSKYILKKYLNSGVKEDKVFLNYAYVDIVQLLKDSEHIKSRNFRQEFNLPENAVIIGTASYIYPPKFYQKEGIKGHDILLESFKNLLKIRQDVYLVIAGSTFGDNLEYENKLKEKAESIAPGKIFFTGGYSHIGEVITNFNVFVYLSKSENLGGVFESLLFRVPTVSSNRGALPDIVIDGQTGYTVSLSDTESIAVTIDQAIEDGGKYVNNGQELVLTTFVKEELIQNSIDIYREVKKRHDKNK